MRFEFADEYDRALEDIACKRADLRLEAWGIWQRSNGVPRISAVIAYTAPIEPDDLCPPLDPTPPVIFDWECEEVDRVIARFGLNPFKRSLVKIALIEYCTVGPREVKCRRAHLTEKPWRNAVRRLQATVASDLFTGA